MPPTHRSCLLGLQILRRGLTQPERRRTLQIQAETIAEANNPIATNTTCRPRASTHALSPLLADAGGAEENVCAGVAVANTGGAGVEIDEGAVDHEGAKVVKAGVDIQDEAGGKKSVGDIVFGFDQVAFGVLETCEYLICDAAGGCGRSDFAGLENWAGFIYTSH